MPAGVATAEGAAAPKAFASAGELREVLTRLLSEVDRSSELGGRLRSERLSYRYVFTDLGLTLDVASSDDDAHNVRWSFDEQPGWEPQLTLEMNSEIANRYLQGRENIAIALARGRIRCSGGARAALTLLPTSADLSAVYRDVLERHYPHLLLR
jgi:hypothetical protein